MCAKSLRDSISDKRTQSMILEQKTRRNAGRGIAFHKCSHKKCMQLQRLEQQKKPLGDE
jgi:hypothetical protein